MNHAYQINRNLLEIASQIGWQEQVLDGILEGLNLVDEDKKEVWLALVKKLIEEEKMNLILGIVLKMQKIKNLDELQFSLNIYDDSSNLYFGDTKDEYIANCMVALLRKKKLSSTSKQF